MYWNGTRWIDERAPAPRSTRRRRGARDWMATGVMIVGIVALAIPFAATSAASTPTLKLVATVSGGSAAPSAWTLNAGTNTDSFSGHGPAVGPSSIAAGVAYSMFETGGPSSGYTASGWVCSDPTGAPVSLAGQRVTLQAGQNATCTITNTYLAGATPTPAPVAAPTPTPVATPTPTPARTVTAASTPTLKLVATVSGGSAAPSAWTLNAGTNTDSFSGHGPVVGPSPIAAGVAYTMFETGGPSSGYSAGGWVCSDPTGAPVSLAGQRVTLQAGQNATCTITNTYGTTATPTPPPRRS